MRFHTSMIRAGYRAALAAAAAALARLKGGNEPFRGRPDPSSLKKVLVIRKDGIGDTILATPVFESLKKGVPGVKVSVLARRYNRKVLDGNPYVDEVIEYCAGNIRGLKDKKFDLALALTYDFDLKDALACYRSGAAVRAGFKAKHTSAFYNFEVEKDPGPKYEAERNLELLEKLGLPVVRSRPALYPSKAEEEKAALFFKTAGIAPGDVVIGLNPGSGRKPRRWPVQRYAELIAMLLKEMPGTKPVVCEGPGEEIYTHELRRMCGDGFTSLIDAGPNLSCVVFKRFNAFVCCDTGPIHIAMAAGIPIVGLYGLGDYQRWAPPDNPLLSMIRSKKVREITAGEVMEKIKSILYGKNNGADK